MLKVKTLPAIDYNAPVELVGDIAYSKAVKFIVLDYEDGQEIYLHDEVIERKEVESASVWLDRVTARQEHLKSAAEP
jgi:hypothetical protein